MIKIHTLKKKEEKKESRSSIIGFASLTNLPFYFSDAYIGLLYVSFLLDRAQIYINIIKTGERTKNWIYYYISYKYVIIILNLYFRFQVLKIILYLKRLKNKNGVERYRDRKINNIENFFFFFFLVTQFRSRRQNRERKRERIRDDKFGCFRRYIVSIFNLQVVVNFSTNTRHVY